MWLIDLLVLKMLYHSLISIRGGVMSFLPDIATLVYDNDALALRYAVSTADFKTMFVQFDYRMHRMKHIESMFRDYFRTQFLLITRYKL